MSEDLIWQFDVGGIDWDELADLYRKAPLGNKRPEDLKVAFENSRFVCFIRLRGQLIGAGRALADGVDASYICDIALLPDHQGMGLGKAIVSKLVGLSKGHRKILLYAVPGKEPFYSQLGFKPMLTAMAIFEDEETAIKKGFIQG